ncbi:MAG TPA: protein kinase [Gemmatimonadales bacterium]|nr:protein kinase [Gemmatimonadales bacterium]
MAIVLVVVAILGGALALIRFRASQTADAAIDRGLHATQSAIDDALEARSHALQQLAKVLAQVPPNISRIEEALHSGNRANLLDQADEFREQGAAAWAMITDQAGVLQASTRSATAFGDSLGNSVLVGEALSGTPTRGIWVESTPAGDSLFQAIAVPLAAPGGSVVGALVMALPIDMGFAERLKRQTASEVVFIAFDTLGVPRVAASTLPAGTLDEALQKRNAEGTAPDSVPKRLRVKAGGMTWMAAVGPLQTASGVTVGEYAGLRAREAELAPFTLLQRSIVYAFFAALGIALIISLILARQITSPLRQLVDATRGVAEGRYEGSLDIKSHDEIGELAEAFQRMLDELREKQRLVEFLGGAGGGRTLSASPTSAVHTPSKLMPGSVLANRYEIREQLGAGGMGVVYRAFDKELQEQVAIKTLQPGLLGDAHVLERFKQEIRLARKISHPNVVRTHDLGESDGTYFITMEYVEGTSLDELLDQRGALPLGVILTIGRQLCRALEVAHAVGVVHRDIKPPNLVLDAQGFLKVMDFGIARLVERRQPGNQLTATGGIIGTPEYMAPEQLMGEPVDGRADLYAAGTVLFECATGKRVFNATSFGSILLKQVQETPPDPRTMVPGLPPAFAELILKALAKKPADRWQTAEEFHQALDRVRV